MNLMVSWHWANETLGSIPGRGGNYMILGYSISRCCPIVEVVLCRLQQSGGHHGVLQGRSLRDFWGRPRYGGAQQWNWPEFNPRHAARRSGHDVNDMPGRGCQRPLLLKMLQHPLQQTLQRGGGIRI